MKTLFLELLSEVESSISNVLNLGKGNILELAEKAAIILYEAVAKLKEIIRGYSFSDNEEEITFFKDIKPQLCSKLIFYKSLWRLESCRPSGQKDMIKQYLLQEIEMIYDFQQKHLFIYQYYITGATYFDSVFFLRGKCPQICRENFEDDYFTTLCDLKFAELQANELLLDYLQNEINVLDNIKTLPLSFNLKWVFPKRALVQLIYALYAKKCFGEKATIKDITDWIETTLDIDLKDVYHTYKDFKERTLNPVNFLEELQEVLLKKIREDEN